MDGRMGGNTAPFRQEGANPDSDNGLNQRELTGVAPDDTLQTL